MPTPVDFDPFGSPEQGQPVDHDPWKPANLEQAAQLQPDINIQGPRFRPERTRIRGGLTEERLPLGDILNMEARAVADHASYGQANKIAAALTPGSYEENLAKQEAASAELKEKSPGLYAGMGAIGLAASPLTRAVGWAANRALPIATEAGKASPFLRRYGNYMTQGAGVNALYQPTLGENPEAGKESAAAGAMTLGATSGGTSSPFLRDPLRMAPDGGGGIPRGVTNTIKNAAVGAGAGAIPPAVLEAGGPIMSTVLSPILSRLSPEEAALAQIGRAAARQNLTPDMLSSKLSKLGEPGMLANVGGQVTDYARDIAQFPGRARSLAQSAFGAQQGGRMSTAGGAVGRAESAINNTLTDETARTTTDALVDLRTKTSSPTWKTMFAEPRVPESPILDVLADNPEVRRGMGQGLATIRNDLNSLGIKTDAANYYIDGKPTFQAWHAGKEGLDDILFSGDKKVVNELTGKLTKYGRSVSNMRSSILEELKLQYPEYADALDTWSGPTAAMRAIELGQKAARGDARVTSELLSEMTPNERDFARIGYADQAKFLVSKTRRGGNVTTPFFSDQNAARNAEAFFPDRQSFNEFRKAMAVEEKMHSSKHTVLGGSVTANKLAGAEDVAQDIGKATLEGAAKGGAPGAAVSLLQKGWNYLKAPPEAVRDAAGQMMFSTDPVRNAQTLEALTRNHNQGSVFGSPWMTMLPGVGTVNAARFGALPQ